MLGQCPPPIGLQSPAQISWESRSTSMKWNRKRRSATRLVSRRTVKLEAEDSNCSSNSQTYTRRWRTRSKGSLHYGKVMLEWTRQMYIMTTHHSKVHPKTSSLHHYPKGWITLVRPSPFLIARMLLMHDRRPLWLAWTGNSSEELSAFWLSNEHYFF